MSEYVIQTTVFIFLYILPIKNPVIVIKIVITEELYDRSVITFIQTDNKNKTRSKFQNPSHVHTLQHQLPRHWKPQHQAMQRGIIG